MFHRFVAVYEAHAVNDRPTDRNARPEHPHRPDGVASSEVPDADETPPPTRRRTGRPRSGEGPIIPWQEVDKALVFGEVVRDPKTGREAVKYPSIAVLAKRYDCSRTVIWRFASRSRCYARREEARLKTQETYERKVIEKLANTQVQAAVDVTGIVDSYIDGFRQALKAGRVRVDSPADLDRLVRLKELLTGHADSRNELQGELSLEAIQGRHRRLRGQVEAMTPELAGTTSELAGDGDAAPHTGGEERGDGAAR